MQLSVIAHDLQTISQQVVLKRLQATLFTVATSVVHIKQYTVKMEMNSNFEATSNKSVQTLYGKSYLLTVRRDSKNDLLPVWSSQSQEVHSEDDKQVHFYSEKCFEWTIR